MKNGKHWPLIIIGMLVFNAIAMAVIVIAAHSDPSHHVKDDYYQHALDWDSEMAQQRVNAGLGWVARVTAMPLDAGAGAVELELTAADGHPIIGAAVQLTAYHLSRAGDVKAGTMTPVGESGRYRLVLPMQRTGVWNVAVAVSVGEVRFTHAATIELLRPVADLGGSPL